MITKPKILVFGATGQVGGAVLPHLTANPNVEVREFYDNVLAAGAEPSYMKCVFDSYTDFTAGKVPNSDQVFDNIYLALSAGIRRRWQILPRSTRINSATDPRSLHEHEQQGKDPGRNRGNRELGPLWAHSRAPASA
jgi:hypothetical protein